MSARTSFSTVALCALAAAVAPGCSSGFGRIGPSAALVVNITGGDALGAPNARLRIPIATTAMYIVDIEAHKADGTLDTSFNGFVRASVKPGTVQTVGASCRPEAPNPVGAPFTDGRNVQLANGVARGVKVCVAAAYGDARIWFEDIGYLPADILRNPPPQCSNGVDDNGNGLIDFPADPGCAFANDDTEDGGSFGTGVSQPIYFLAPRVADVRGRTADVMGNMQGGSATNFPHEQVQLDTGQRGDTTTAFATIVTRVSSDGFYVTDLQQDIAGSDPNLVPDQSKVPGFGSVFAFTFSTPPKMRTCDRTKLLGGTASDFHGFTEIGYPTWLLEEWDPSQRECMVPPPHSLSPLDLATPDTMFKLESSLVRIETAGNISLQLASHFGPGTATLMGDPMTGSYVFTNDASSCDFNHDGKITFDGGPENVCSCYCAGCTADPRLPNANPPVPIAMDPLCSEYSQFASQNAVMIGIYQSDPMNPMTPPMFLTKMQVNGSASPAFDALSLKGKPIRSFDGTLRYFSGGSQFTIEARCDDDIVSDLAKAPFLSDADYDCCPASSTGCAMNQPRCDARTTWPTVDGNPPPSIPVPPANRLLACVHARTISDNTEQH